MMDRRVVAELAERQASGQMWEQEMTNEGEGLVTLVYASGGSVEIRPGESVRVLVTTLLREDGKPVMRFLPIGWKHAGQA